MGQPDVQIDPIEQQRARRIRAAYLRDLRRIAREYYERKNADYLIYYLQHGVPPPGGEEEGAIAPVTRNAKADE